MDEKEWAELVTNRDAVRQPQELSSVTDAERECLRAIKYKTQLLSCHPMVVSAVTKNLGDLLVVLGRRDLEEALRRI